ncbi:MAG: glycosyltransferase family 4 protein [Desulfomicrobium sp.]|nr:glycosyltransferase family 4 protein [Desulfomicrobium sp.]
MSKILVLNHQPPFPVHCGNTLRVFNLCRELAKKHICLAVFFSDRTTRFALSNPHADEVFTRSVPLPSITGKASRNRFLHPLEGHLVKRFNPVFWAQTREILKTLIRDERVDVLFVTSPWMAQFVEGLDLGQVRTVIDICDSHVLTLEREYSQHPSVDVRTWLRRRLYLTRAKRDERRVARRFDVVTTVSPVDLARLQVLTQNGRNIHLVPNGVDLPDRLSNHAETERAVIFWGALDFPPNATALGFFYENVWPLIRERGVRWYVVGKNPPKWLRQASESQEHIRLTGYVEDLPSLVFRIPVMVNPMLMGSGLKNKVLEAFAMERAVVSTALGVEAIQAVANTHYVPAEVGSEFADAILSLLDNPLRCAELGTAARALVAKNYSWENAAKCLEHVL